MDTGTELAAAWSDRLTRARDELLAANDAYALFGPEHIGRMLDRVRRARDEVAYWTGVGS